MENNEIMVNEEIIEATEEVTTENSGNGLLIAAIVGGALLVGGIVYKKVIKPAIAKAKAKKEQKEVIEADFEDIESEEA